MKSRTYNVKDESRRDISKWFMAQFGPPVFGAWGGSYPIGPASFTIFRDDWAELFVLVWGHKIIPEPEPFLT